MRTRNLGDASSWRAWNGSAFAMAFVNPHSATSDPPAAHECAHLDNGKTGAQSSSSLTYNGYLGAFVWVGLTNVPLADQIGQPLSSDGDAA